jgi:hypothetical protein
LSIAYSILLCLTKKKKKNLTQIQLIGGPHLWRAPCIVIEVLGLFFYSEGHVKDISDFSYPQKEPPWHFCSHKTQSFKVALAF